MTPLHPGRSEYDQLGYHLGRNDAPEFDVNQPGRIDLARFFIEKMLIKDLTRRPLRIVELGCGSGDVTGPYSTSQTLVTVRGPIDLTGIEVIGIDLVPVAGEKIARRYPHMKFYQGDVAQMEPIDCDLLVATEFLEHLTDPKAVMDAWMPHAEWALIGHPLNEPDPPYEWGHYWSYTEDDWVAWFHERGMQIWEKVKFPMGHWPEMIMGHGSKR